MPKHKQRQKTIHVQPLIWAHLWSFVSSSYSYQLIWLSFSVIHPLSSQNYLVNPSGFPFYHLAKVKIIPIDNILFLFWRCLFQFKSSPTIWRLLSKCQIDSEDFVNFCGLLRKHELYYSTSVHSCSLQMYHISLVSKVIT